MVGAARLAKPRAVTWICLQVCSYKYLQRYNYVKWSKGFFNHLSKTRGVSEFKSDHALYRDLQAWKASSQQDYGLGSHHFYGKMKYSAKKYGTARANMSNVMNKGVKMCCKAVTANFFTLVGLIFEPSIAIGRLKGSLDVSPFIMQPSIAVTSTSTVIYSSLFSSFFFSIMLRTNSRYHQRRGWKYGTVESEVRNSVAL